MKKWSAHIAVFIVLYLVFIMAKLPASFVINQVALPHNIQLSNVEGSIWHSQIAQVQVADVMLEDVDIKVSLLSLLMFNPSLDIEFGKPLVNAPSGQLTALNLFGDLAIHDADVTIPANLLSQYIQAPVPISASNAIALSIPEFEMGQPVCQILSGQVDWKKASVTALEQSVQLGDLQATLGCVQGNIALTINPDNNLGLEFETTIAQGFAISGNGTIKPNAKSPKELQQVLPFLGRPDNQGRYQLSF